MVWYGMVCYGPRVMHVEAPVKSRGKRQSGTFAGSPPTLLDCLHFLPMDSGSRGDINNPAKREPGAGTGEPSAGTGEQGVTACAVTGTLYVFLWNVQKGTYIQPTRKWCG